MKWTILSLLALCALLAVAAAAKGELNTGMKAGGLTFLKFAPILLLAFLISGFIDVLLPEQFVEQWLSDSSGWRGLCVAWLAGVLTPGGSIIGMPMAAGLAKAGVGPAVLITYLTSLATLSLLRVPLEIGFYGWKLMTLRLVTSLVLPFIAGGLARLATPWFSP